MAHHWAQGGEPVPMLDCRAVKEVTVPLNVANEADGNQEGDQHTMIIQM